MNPEKQAKGQAPLSTTYLFVLASDGQDNCNTDKQLEVAIASCGESLRTEGMQTNFLAVGIGPSSDTAVAMKARKAMQTMESGTAEAPIFFAKKQSDVPTVVRQMTEQQLQTRHAPLMRLTHQPSVESSFQEAANQAAAGAVGFIDALASQPTTSITTRMTATAAAEGGSLIFLFR